MTAPAIIVFGVGGVGVAEKLKQSLTAAQIHGFSGRVTDPDVSFERTGEHLRGLFVAGTPIVGVCACAILIRSLAPALSDKQDEPPVVCVAEDGTAVIPLLGSHHGGNDLAREIGAILQVAPAVTTATEARFRVALDAPPPGWRLGNPQDYKAFAGSLLAGDRIHLTGDAPWLAASRLPFDDDGSLRIRVSEARLAGSPGELVYHPQCLAVGVGCERNTDPDELTGLVRRTLAEHGLAEPAVAGVFSHEVKSDEAAVHSVAAALDVPAQFLDAARLEAEAPRLVHPSEVVYREVGCHGVAEGAALAAIGDTGTLIVPKTKSSRATCAIGLAPYPIEPVSVGRARGWLGIVGTGPGVAGWRTAEAAQFLDRATDIVGYGLYLDLVSDRIAGKTQHRYPLGAEEDRVRAALDLAASGKPVALVSSGDPGIYAMAALVFELLDREDRADWRRVEITTAPGISALQAAAARVGAPIGHDFCAISLSDLMTPWDQIETRLRAAGQGDFVVALYNPVSQRRTRQLERARDILLETRDRKTPVVVARNLGRPDERIRITCLAEITPDAADMVTVLLVGSSSTRLIPRQDGQAWVYTPRGYGGGSSDEGAG